LDIALRNNTEIKFYKTQKEFTKNNYIMEDSKFIFNPWLIAGFISIILAAVLFYFNLIDITSSIALIVLSLVFDIIAIIQIKKSKNKEE